MFVDLDKAESPESQTVVVAGQHTTLDILPQKSWTRRSPSTS
jgi:hypothetical protein